MIQEKETDRHALTDDNSKQRKEHTYRHVRSDNLTRSRQASGTDRNLDDEWDMNFIRSNIKLYSAILILLRPLWVLGSST